MSPGPFDVKVELFAWGLPEWWDAAELEKHFAHLGTVITARICRKENGESKCSGFVTYGDAEAARRAVWGLDGLAVDDDNILHVAAKNGEEKHVPPLPEFYPPKGEGSWDSAAGVEGPAGANIIVTNLPDPWGAENLHRHFKHYGNIIALHADSREETGYIGFEQPESAHRAVEGMNGYQTGYGSTLEVTARDGEEEMQQVSERVEAVVDQFWEALKQQKASPAAPAPKSTEGAVAYVYEMPEDWTADDLRERFSPYGNIKTISVNKQEGHGFVAFDSSESATMAILALHGELFDGRTLRVQLRRDESSAPRTGRKVVVRGVMAPRVLGTPAPKVALKPKAAGVQQQTVPAPPNLAASKVVRPPRPAPPSQPAQSGASSQTEPSSSAQTVPPPGRKKPIVIPPKASAVAKRLGYSKAGILAKRVLPQSKAGILAEKKSSKATENEDGQPPVRVPPRLRRLSRESAGSSSQSESRQGQSLGRTIVFHKAGGMVPPTTLERPAGGSASAPLKRPIDSRDRERERAIGVLGPPAKKRLATGGGPVRLPPPPPQAVPPPAGHPERQSRDTAQQTRGGHTSSLISRLKTLNKLKGHFAKSLAENSRGRSAHGDTDRGIPIGATASSASSGIPIGSFKAEARGSLRREEPSADRSASGYRSKGSPREQGYSWPNGSTGSRGPVTVRPPAYRDAGNRSAPPPRVVPAARRFPSGGGRGRPGSRY